MKIRVYIVALCVFAMLRVTAQQMPMYNHYFLKPLVYNPAFSGHSGDIQAALISRSQWASFAGGPQLNILAVDGAIKEKKVGLGLILSNDRRGISIRNSAMLSYSYRFNFNEDAYLALGLAAGIANQSIDFSKAIAENYTDPTLLGGIQQRTMFDLNAGLLFGWKGLQIAAAAPQLLENRYNFNDNTGTKTFYAEMRHYVASLKYRFLLSKDKGIGIAPQFLVRSVANTPLQYDANLTFDWENKFWLGGTYKSNYAISINAGVIIHKRVSIGYSYEVITADIGKYSGVSHELFLNFRFGGGAKKEEEEKTEPIAEETNEARYKQRIDSLQQALSANSDAIAELNRKLEQQAKAQKEAKDQLAAMEQNVRNVQSQQNNTAAQGNNVTQQNNAQTQNNNGGFPGGETKNTSVTSQNTSKNNTSQKSAEPKNTKSGNNKSTEPVNQQTAQTSGNENKTEPVTSIPNGVKAPSALDMLDSKVYEKGVWIATYPPSGFKDENNLHPKPGFYIIVGTFFYQDFAIAEVQRFRKRGYKECNWIYSENTKHNYIFTRRITSRAEAISKVKEVQVATVKDAWILELK